jgi:hypothetical protein
MLGCERSGLPVGPGESEPVNMLSEGQDLSKSASGPPLKWVEENGILHQIVGHVSPLKLMGLVRRRITQRVVVNDIGIG